MSMYLRESTRDNDVTGLMSMQRVYMAARPNHQLHYMHACILIVLVKAMTSSVVHILQFFFTLLFFAGFFFDVHDTILSFLDYCLFSDKLLRVLL